MTRQYYFKQNLCRALSAHDADCICWHDEGTGVYAATSYPHLQWRDKPAAPTDESGQTAGFGFASKNPELEELLKAAKAKVDAMTPDELQAMLEAQARSWARGEAALDRKPVGPAPSTHVRAYLHRLTGQAGWNLCLPHEMHPFFEYQRLAPEGIEIVPLIAATPSPEMKEVGSE